MLVVCVFHLSALNNRVLKNYKKDVHGSWGFFNRTKHDVLKKIQSNLTHHKVQLNSCGLGWTHGFNNFFILLLLLLLFKSGVMFKPEFKWTRWLVNIYIRSVHGSCGFFNRTYHDVLKKIQSNLTRHGVQSNPHGLGWTHDYKQVQLSIFGP